MNQPTPPLPTEAALRTVQEAISEVAPDVDPTSVGDGDDLWFELELDSMDQLAVMTAIGRRTGIEVPEADYPNLLSVSDLVAYLTADQR